MDYPSCKIGDCNFSCFGFIVRSLVGESEKSEEVSTRSRMLLLLWIGKFMLT